MATRLALPTEYAVLASTAANSADLLNFQVETAPKGSRGTPGEKDALGRFSSFILRPTPGLVQDFTLGTGPMVEMDGTLQGTIYAVSGTHAYRVAFPPGSATPTITDLGNIGAPPNPLNPAAPAKLVTISVGLLAAVFLNPPNAYWVSHSGTSLTQITDPNYPGADSVAYLDGVFYFALGTQVFGTALLDAATLPALNFAYADAVPNISIQKLITYNGDIWFMGDAGCEVFYDAGTANFALAPRPGGTLTQGTANGASVRICDGSLFWLGNDGIVYRSAGYRADRISTYALEEWIQRHADVVHLDALSYVLQGHWTYVLNFSAPGGDAPASFAYDTKEKRWHRRASTGDGSGVYRGNKSAQFGADILIGDRLDSRVYTLDSGGDSDAGTQVFRQVTLPPVYADGRRAVMARVELECEISATGPNPGISLAISDDGGQTYSAAQAASGTVLAGRRGALYWTRKGSFRQRNLRFSVLGRATMYAVEADIDQGT
jgi:hypothetical protein